jgi:hypothetical protein
MKMFFYHGFARMGMDAPLNTFGAVLAFVAVLFSSDAKEESESILVHFHRDIHCLI